MNQQEAFPLKKVFFFTGLDNKEVLNTPLKKFLVDWNGLKVEAKAELTGESLHQLDNPHWPSV